MCTILAQHKAYKTTLIEGVAASIASIIALSGDEVHMAADGMIMIHDPWTTSTGNAAELQKRLACWIRRRISWSIYIAVEVEEILP